MKPPSLFLLAWACASPSLALTLSLDEVASRARTHHPALKAARLAVEEARGRQLGAGRLANPSLGYDFQNQSNLSPQTGVVSLDQSFPLTRRLSLEKKLTSQMVVAAELEVRDSERRLVAEAKSQAVRLLTLSRQRQLRQQQMDLAQKLADFASDRAEAGEVSPLDARQVQLDSQKLRIESRLLEAASVAVLGQLKPMLGLRSEEPLTLTGGLPTLELPPASSWRQRPDYRLAQTKAEAAQTGQQLARARRIPDVTAGLFGAHEMQDVTSAQRESTGFVGFRFSIPLPLWNRNQGEIAETAASAERARLEAEALAVQIHGEAGTARREMETNASIVRETRETLVPLAVQHSAEMEKAYKNGQTDLLSVLRSRDQRLQLESAALDAERDFHLARIRYEAATSH
ncbi:MAG TPA: hypothetical protein DIT64_00295 [Verrucomicrobiales bacterium]|nr:hypothetical protein [Verrucomicrobiales bacterium]